MGDVETFYGDSVEIEWARLEDPYGRLELLSHLALIDRHFSPNQRVCDIGGGPGRYSMELLHRGHRVTLVDLTPEFVEAARTRLKAVGLDDAINADARDLSMIDDCMFDAALVMGPLYHLHLREGRLRVLQETHRILRPGGLAILAYLNSWGLVRTGVVDFPEHYEEPGFVQSLEGQRSFGIWWWSTPIEARAEIESAGFEVLEYAGLEGFASGMAPLVRELAKRHPDGYERFIDEAVKSSILPRYRDATDHVSFVVRRPA